MKQPKGDFFIGEDKICKYGHFAVSNGKIDIQVDCSEGGSTRTTNMSGTYTPTSYAMNISSNGSVGGAPRTTTKMHVHSARVGECTAKGS